jgi:sulfoxide reductase heme-binding subunit YedZ
MSTSDVVVRAPRKPARWLKPAVFVAALTPLVLIGVDALRDRLGANPIAEVLNRLGFWTLFLLTCALACTPLKILFGLTWPIRVRRMIGLFAFFYGVLHFSTYVGLDQVFDLNEILKDIVKRKFITIGFATLVILTPLAVTSTNAMVRRLGFVRWKRLHRLIYLAAVGGFVHFVWRVKADLRRPLIFGAVIAVLLGVRVVAWLKDLTPSPSLKGSGDRPSPQ